MVLTKEFKIGDLFLLYMPITLLNKTVDKIKNLDSTELFPLLQQTSSNNGIVDYIFLEDKYLINTGNKSILVGSTNSQSLNVWNTPFYAINAGNTFIVENKNLTPLNILYLKSCMDKLFLQKYSYSNKNSLFKMKEDIISLPVKSLSDSEPDWEYMEKYIKEIEKKSIQKVLEDNRKEIENLEKIIGI